MLREREHVGLLYVNTAWAVALVCEVPPKVQTGTFLKAWLKPQEPEESAGVLLLDARPEPSQL